VSQENDPTFSAFLRGIISQTVRNMATFSISHQ